MTGEISLMANPTLEPPIVMRKTLICLIALASLVLFAACSAASHVMAGDARDPVTVDEVKVYTNPSRPSKPGKAYEESQ